MWGFPISNLGSLPPPCLEARRSGLSWLRNFPAEVPERPFIFWTNRLHFADVHKLTEILQRLAEGGNTVIVIEHNLDVIKTADYIIDMGPEGGDGGGTVVAQGTPEEIAEIPASYTGCYVKKYLQKEKTVVS